MAKIIFAPSRFAPLGFDATFSGAFLFEQIECHMSQDDKGLLAVIGCRMCDWHLLEKRCQAPNAGHFRHSHGFAQLRQMLASPPAGTRGKS